jgi:predicted RNA methylase
MCDLKDFSNLSLDNDHLNTLVRELDLWHRTYLPIIGTYLDIGAGNGETAQFALNHGAKHVICIEPNADLLYKNFGRDSRVTIIPMSVDCIKSDCEGAEKNMTAEIHFPFKIKVINPHFTNKRLRLVKVQEDWGNIFTKTYRKITKW